jgi:hypothetical protein
MITKRIGLRTPNINNFNHQGPRAPRTTKDLILGLNQKIILALLGALGALVVKRGVVGSQVILAYFSHILY